MVSLYCQGQHFGNSNFLKYSLTPYDLSADVQVHSFILSNSPSKSFVLRNFNSSDFNLGTTFKPIDVQSNGESSGESIRLSPTTTPKGYSIGYRYTSHVQHQLHATWNKTLFKDDEKKKTQVYGYVFGGDQTITDKRLGSKYERSDQGLNAFLSLSNGAYNSKNRYRFESLTMLNNARSNFNVRFLHFNNHRLNGQLFLNKFMWDRKFSANHSMSTALQYEDFNYTIDNEFWQGQLFPLSRTGYSQWRLSVKDNIVFKKSRVENTLMVNHNELNWKLNSNDLSQSYQLALLSSEYTRFFKNSRSGLEYNQRFGYASNDGIIYNPGIKFFQELDGLKYDLGFLQQSRNPALAEELATFYNSTPNALPIQVTQEVYRKVFATTKFDINRWFNMEFKYIYTNSPNKWLFNPTLGKVEQGDFNYTSFYAKLFKTQYQRFSYLLLYKHTIAETTSAEVMPKHQITGNCSYKFDKQSFRLFKRYRYIDFSFDLNANYLSAHQLPFMDEAIQAEHEGGVFADTYFKLTLLSQGRYSYTYYETYDTKGIDKVELRFGVNNLLNTRATLQPLAANEYKPIVQRQMSAGLTLSF